MPCPLCVGSPDSARRLAVADLSLTITPGGIFGFLGPNGAGKTTSVKLLLSLVAPSGGSGTVLGEPIGHRLTRSRIGFLPEHFRFHDCLTGREFLRFHGRLYGLGGQQLDKRVDSLLERVDLVEAGDVQLRQYSKGMTQRAGIAQALLNDPDLVFLDEPTSGLDPLGRLLVRDLLRELRARGTTVFLNSLCLGRSRPRATASSSSSTGGPCVSSRSPKAPARSTSCCGSAPSRRTGLPVSPGSAA